MNQNNDKLIAMVYRRVNEAIRKVAVNGVDFTDDEIADVSDEYTAKIVVGVFGGGKVIAGGSPFAEVIRNLREINTFNLVTQAIELGQTNPHSDLSEAARSYASEIVENFDSSTEQTEFVDKYYEMDPETEDVLHNGTLVVDDMKVLVESPMHREVIHENMDSANIYNAKTKNRWATVEQSKVALHGNQHVLTFIAVYDDGVKRKIVHGVEFAWLVKKDSIPRTDYILRVTPEGAYSTFNGRTKKVVEFLKDIPLVKQGSYQVQTGRDGDVMSVGEYLAIQELGPEETYDVVGPDGDIIFGGNKDAVVEYLQGKSEELRLACSVGRTDSEEMMSAMDFLMEHGG